MLEQFFVPLNPATDIENCEATVRLKPTGSESCVPSLPDDDLWDETNKQLAEVLHFIFPQHIGISRIKQGKVDSIYCQREKKTIVFLIFVSD